MLLTGVALRVGAVRVPLGRATLTGPGAAALLAALVLLAVYTVLHPSAPDLAAQYARTYAVGTGWISWWTGWYGGLTLPTYSVYVPTLMAAIGIRAVGMLGVLATAAGAGSLCRDTLRPRAGAVALVVAQVADLAAGRVTFVLGSGLAIVGLGLLRRRRPLLAAVALALALLASPLAGFFAGLVLVGVAATDRSRRRGAVGAALVLAAIAGVLAALFPGVGTMPFALDQAIVPAASCLLVILCCPVPAVRATAVTVLVAMPLLVVLPGGIGANIIRMVWLFAAPTVVCCARVDRRLVAGAAVALAVAPVQDLAVQWYRGEQPASRDAFYQPLWSALDAQTATAGPMAVGERLEIVAPNTQWAAAYGVAHASLARGWDRQVDVAQNPIFYRPGALTPASYRAWLAQLAVGWVALPDVAYDQSAAAEAQLVRAGPSYLRAVWHSADWVLYRVQGSTPLVSGATPVAVDAGGITFRTTGAATVTVRIRCTSGLVLDDDVDGPSDIDCGPNAQSVVAAVPRAGAYRLTSGRNAGVDVG